MIGPHVQPGIATDELDRLCHDYIVNELGAIPAPLNYRGRAVPEVDLHLGQSRRLPRDSERARRLRIGDIVNIDVTVIKDGYHGDTSRMFFVGDAVDHRPSGSTRVCFDAMWRGIRAIQPGSPARRHRPRGPDLSSRSSASPSCASTAGTASVASFTRTRKCCITASRGTGVELVPGMTITVEPMVNAGKREVKLLSDGWTVVTKDHSLSAQWEHTVLVTPTRASRC